MQSLVGQTWERRCEAIGSPPAQCKYFPYLIDKLVSHLLLPTGDMRQAHWKEQTTLVGSGHRTGVGKGWFDATVNGKHSLGPTK